MLGSVAKVSVGVRVCRLLLCPCLALLLLAPSAALSPTSPPCLCSTKSVVTASPNFPTLAKSDTAPTWAGSQHSNMANWDPEVNFLDQHHFHCHYFVIITSCPKINNIHLTGIKTMLTNLDSGFPGRHCWRVITEGDSHAD